MPTHDAVPVPADELAELRRDAARWREHERIWHESREFGAVVVRITMTDTATGVGKQAVVEFVITHDELRAIVPPHKIVAIAAERYAYRLFEEVKKQRAAMKD